LRKTPYSHLFSEDFTVLKAVRWSVPRLTPRLIKKALRNLYHLERALQ
jgi:hypothetical protein